MYGYSYPGLVQLLAAATRPPSLAAICPGFTSSQAYDGWIYSHGAIFLGWAMTWALFLAHDTARRNGDDEVLREVRTALLHVTDEYWNAAARRTCPRSTTAGLPTYYRDWIDHPTHDDYWKRWSIDADYSRLTVPALHFTGWYDGFLRGTVDNYVGMRDARARRAAAGRVAVDARAVDARVGLRRLEPGVHERRRCPSGLVRPPAQGTRRRRVRRQHLHPARRLARLPRLAAARDATPRALPPLGRAGQLAPRRRRRSRPRRRATSRPTSTPTTPTCPRGARAATRAATPRPRRWAPSRRTPPSRPRPSSSTRASRWPAT